MPPGGYFGRAIVVDATDGTSAVTDLGCYSAKEMGRRIR